MTETAITLVQHYGTTVLPFVTAAVLLAIGVIVDKISTKIRSKKK